VSEEKSLILEHYNWKSFFRVKVKGPKDSIYEGEAFQLQFIFNDKYPFEPPIVTFVGSTENIPVHPHVYSNGHVCISVLGDDWTPGSYIIHDHNINILYNSLSLYLSVVSGFSGLIDFKHARFMYQEGTSA
jgi:ubiquitin-protein ligase